MTLAGPSGGQCAQNLHGARRWKPPVAALCRFIASRSTPARSHAPVAPSGSGVALVRRLSALQDRAKTAKHGPGFGLSTAIAPFRPTGQTQLSAIASFFTKQADVRLAAVGEQMLNSPPEWPINDRTESESRQDSYAENDGR
jgi:hypothetical protein